MTSVAGAPDNAARVSVVLATWNGVDYLPTAIGQIRRQTFEDYEVLVVDDGSNDASASLLSTWADDDERVTVVRNETRRGVAASRNRALDSARGEFVWFADCDDEWSEHILERLVREADRVQADVVVCGAVQRRVDSSRLHPVRGAEGPPVSGGQEALQRLLRGEIRGHLWNKLFRRSLFEHVRFPPTRAFSDLGGVGPLLARAHRVALLDESLYTYIIRPGSILNTKAAPGRDLLACRDVIVAAVRSLPASPRLLTDLVRFEYAEIYVPMTNSLIRDGDDGEECRRIRGEVRAAMSLTEMASLARHGAVRLAVVSLAVKYAFPVYAAAYRRFRRVKWGSTGTWTR